MICWEVNIAHWICLCLPIWGPGFKSQARHQRFFDLRRWYLLMKRTKIKLKDGIISPILFEDQLFIQFIATNYCLANRGQLKEEFPTRAWIRTCDDDIILFGDLSRVLGDLAAELLAPADVDVEQRRHLVLLRQQVRRNCRSYRYQLGWSLMVFYREIKLKYPNWKGLAKHGFKYLMCINIKTKKELKLLNNAIRLQDFIHFSHWLCVLID